MVICAWVSGRQSYVLGAPAIGPAAKGKRMYSIWFTNFGYSPEARYASLKEAVAAAQKAGWDALIYQGENQDTLIGTWSIIGGLRRFL